MIPSELRAQELMLCAASRTVNGNVHQAVEQLHRLGGYFFEQKFDGIRCIAFVDNGIVQLVNRRSVDITYRYPEIVQSLSTAFPTQSRVFDGEIICLNNGKPDFSRSHMRDAQQNVKSVAALIPLMPATFMIFDLLFNGEDLRRVAYAGRRALLQVETANGDALAWSCSTRDGLSLWQDVLTNGLEGLIAKRDTSFYKAGRNSWIKLKVTHTVSVIATGYTAGQGKRAPGIGAVEMSLIRDGAQVRCGEVGTGFSDADLKRVKIRMDAGELLVLEVELSNITKDGKFRFPSFKGVRTDMSLLDCQWDQVLTIPVI